MHILNSVRPDRQLVLFSATFPRSMEALARRILTKPLEITVGGKSVVCDDVTQNVVVLNDEDKFLKLLELLGRFQESGSVIVFTHKHEVADALLKEVLKAGYPAQAIHGGMDQYDRDSVINDFKKVEIMSFSSVLKSFLGHLNLVDRNFCCCSWIGCQKFDSSC